MEQESKTTIDDLEEVVRNAPEFRYQSSHQMTGIGEISTEALIAEYEGNSVYIHWQWVGKFDGGKGFRDEHLNSGHGLKKGKIWSDWYLYRHIMDYPSDERDEERRGIFKALASVACEKYLLQTKT